MTRHDVLPHDSRGEIDWLGLVRTTWPVIVSVIIVALWFGGRMESDQQKQRRINASIAPVLVELKALHEEIDTHEGMGGHAEMLVKIGKVEGKLDALYVLVLQNGNHKGGNNGG